VKQLIEKYSLEELCEAAENYFKHVKDWNYLLTKPFASPHEVPSLLINFAYLIKGLQLVAGLTVLDFGAGSCWASRFLNQMGCSVVSLDTSATALQIGKELKNRLPVIGSQPEHRFMHFNGTRIDLPDASVDRIFCHDAFHHVPNQSEVLDEMCRVLKKGGIAGFSEPGPNHSKSPQAQEEMRNHAIIENDIIIADVFEKAKRSGFTRMQLLCYSLEPIVALFDESNTLLEQDDLFATYIHHTVNYMQSHNTFFLHKGEISTHDSRYKDGLLAGIEVSVKPRTVQEGEDFLCEVTINNNSDKLWLASGGNIGAVNLGIHLYDADHNLIDSDWFRAHLSDQDVRPDERVQLQFRIPAPAGGKYQLEFDLVSEGVCWFETNGSQTQIVEVSVRKSGEFSS